jgi:RNA polymerase sigma factor (sigma-70 family)
MGSNIDANKLADGDEEEFKNLVKEIQLREYSNLRRHFGDALPWPEIEDVFSDALIDMAESINERKFEPQEGGTAEGWAHTKVFGKAVDHIRAKNRKGPQLAEGDTRPPIVSLDDPDVEHAEWRHLSAGPTKEEEEEDYYPHPDKILTKRAFDASSDLNKPVVHARLGEGKNYKEIAKDLGISAALARKRCERGVEQTRKNFNDLKGGKKLKK